MSINTKSATSIKAYISGLISMSCFLFIENQGPCLSVERWKRSSDVSRPFSCYWWWNVLHLLQHVFDVHKPTEKEGAINSVEKCAKCPCYFLECFSTVFFHGITYFWLSKWPQKFWFHCHCATAWLCSFFHDDKSCEIKYSNCILCKFTSLVSFLWIAVHATSEDL